MADPEEPLSPAEADPDHPAAHGDVPTDVPPASSAPVGYEFEINPLPESKTEPKN